MKALVTGATGFIGSRLVARLDRPRVLTRDPARAERALGEVEAVRWDALEGPPPEESLEGVEAVFHLAGDPVAKGRWNEEKRRRIRDSRVLGTRHLVAALARTRKRPRVLVSSSAVGFYGDRGDETLDETSPPGDDFLARVCGEWEAEASKASDLGVRPVVLRTGVVLGGGGGALEEMLLPFRMGVGGRIGDGRQWFPWVHRDDMVGLYLFAAGKEGLEGPVNAVAPNPARNEEFTKALGRVLHRPTVLPVPVFGLRILLGGVAEVITASLRVVPSRALEAGYEFVHPELEEALRDIVRGPAKTAAPGRTA